MLNFFKKPNVNKKFIQSNSHNLIKVDTKYGNTYLLKHDEFITNSFKRGNYWAENEIKIIEDLNFNNLKISVKSSDVFLSIKSYKLLSQKTDYPLHLGITEAGSYIPGSIKSAVGLGSLLMEGIGDTIRVSLSAQPSEEVKVGYELLKSLGLRRRGVTVISCPSCARQGFNVIETVKILEKKLSHIKTPITLSVIGCVVNGPGEAALTDIGITGGKKGNNMLYLSGVQSEKVLTSEIINKVISEVEKKAAEIENK